MLAQSDQQLPLAGEDSILRFGERKPACLIDFGEDGHSTTSRGPFQRDWIAADGARVHILFERERIDVLPASLPYRRQRSGIAVEGNAKFLRYLSAGGIERLLARFDQAFGYLPRAHPLVLPERPARMAEQDFGAIWSDPVEDYSCASLDHAAHSTPVQRS